MEPDTICYDIWSDIVVDGDELEEIGIGIRCFTI